MLSISTSWNHKPDLDMKDWLVQIKEIGFEAIELGYTLTDRQVKDILNALIDMNLKVSSIHNFCPIPNDGPTSRHPSNYYRLSARDDHERTKAVEWTNKTIDLAADVGASVVIIHAGTLEFDHDPAKSLFRMFAKGLNDTDEFKKAKEEFLKVREKHKEPYIQILEKSLDEIVGHSRTKNVKIGLETRYYPIEIPNFEEIGFFLNRFGPKEMGYWHDVGHAQINEWLGIRPHLDFLNAYRDRLIGMHLHGIRKTRDHLAPFEGDMDLSPILPFLDQHLIKVVEARFADTDQIKTAFTRLTNS